jgi:hypothetical protein
LINFLKRLIQAMWRRDIFAVKITVVRQVRCDGSKQISAP